MSELCCLFLHHLPLDTGATLKHHQEAQKHCPTVVPLSFQTVKVSKEGWRGAYYVDILVYEWFRQTQPNHERYFLMEYDTEMTMPPKEFYCGEWDKPIVGSVIIHPLSDAPVTLNYPTKQRDWGWFWIWLKTELGEAEYAKLKPNLRGITPISGILLSHEALSAMTKLFFDTPWMSGVFCECRIGTLAKLAGYEPVSGTTSKNIWCDFVSPNGPGIWHKVR